MDSMLPRAAAQALRVTPQTVREWCKQHHIGVRIGGRWWVSHEAVELIGRGTPLDEVAARVSKQ